MDLMSKIINNLQNLESGLDSLLAENDRSKAEIHKLKEENEDLKKRIQIIHSEMEIYIKELKEIRAHYVSSYDNAK